MSKAKYKQQVADFIELWKPVLGLATWTVNVEWKRVLKPSRRAAQVTVEVKYRIADMQFSEVELRRASLVELEHTVVHELVHLLTEPLAAGAEETPLETVTTDVELAIIRSRDAGMAACIGED